MDTLPSISTSECGQAVYKWRGLDAAVIEQLWDGIKSRANIERKAGHAPAVFYDTKSKVIYYIGVNPDDPQNPLEIAISNGSREGAYDVAMEGAPTWAHFIVNAAVKRAVQNIEAARLAQIEAYQFAPASPHIH